MKFKLALLSFMIISNVQASSYLRCSLSTATAWKTVEASIEDRGQTKVAKIDRSNLLALGKYTCLAKYSRSRTTSELLVRIQNERQQDVALAHSRVRDIEEGDEVTAITTSPEGFSVQCTCEL